MGQVSQGKVLWIPSPPKLGVVSMHRYWDELRNVYNSKVESEFLVEELVNFNASVTRKNVLLRGLENYIDFPIRVALKRSFDIMHGLAHDAATYMQHAQRGVAKVVTVHDLIPLVYHEDNSRSQLARFKAHINKLKSVDTLVAVSSYTASEIERHLGVDSSKIHVIPNGVNAAFFKYPQAKPRVLHALNGKPYVLSVSGKLKRKNLEILAPFMKGLRESGVDVALVRAGSPLPSAMREDLKKVLGDDLIEVGRCSDEDLSGLYQHAELFVFPSFYEGFGLPVLEAMAASCPVIAANTSSLPEVAGSGVELFDPQSVDEMLDAAVRTMSDRTKYIEYGRGRVEEFSWEAHLDGVFNVYRTLMQ